MALKYKPEGAFATTDLREGNDLASGWRVYWARRGAIFVEREMRSGLVMILKI